MGDAGGRCGLTGNMVTSRENKSMSRSSSTKVSPKRSEFTLNPCPVNLIPNWNLIDNSLPIVWKREFGHSYVINILHQIHNMSHICKAYISWKFCKENMTPIRQLCKP